MSRAYLYIFLKADLVSWLQLEGFWNAVLSYVFYNNFLKGIPHWDILI